MIVTAHVIAAAVLGAGVWSAARQHSLDRAMLVLFATSMLASPLGWVYYLWVLAGPAWACVTNTAIRRVLMASAPAWLVPHFLLAYYGSPAFTITVGSLYTWLLASLWLVAILAPDVPEFAPAGMEQFRHKTSCGAFAR